MLAKYIHDANADYRRICQRVRLGPLRTAAEYHRAVAILDEIVDEIGQQDTHPLADLAETLVLAIAAYEEIHVPVPDIPGPLQTPTRTHQPSRRRRQALVGREYQRHQKNTMLAYVTVELY